jgi:hypothetical protein
VSPTADNVKLMADAAAMVTVGATVGVEVVVVELERVMT